jgi:hypothetical protein
MEKTLRYIFLGLGVLCVVGLVLLGISSIGQYNSLTAQTQVTSEDYLTFGVLYATGFFVTAVFGIMMGVLSRKYCETRGQEILSACVIGLCGGGVLIAAFFWFKFGYA